MDDQQAAEWLRSIAQYILREVAADQLTPSEISVICQESLILLEEVAGWDAEPADVALLLRQQIQKLKPEDSPSCLPT